MQVAGNCSKADRQLSNCYLTNKAYLTVLSSFFLEQAAALLDTKTELDFASKLWLGELPKQIDIRASDVSYIYSHAKYFYLQRTLSFSKLN